MQKRDKRKNFFLIATNSLFGVYGAIAVLFVKDFINCPYEKMAFTLGIIIYDVTNFFAIFRLAADRLVMTLFGLITVFDATILSSEFGDALIYFLSLVACLSKVKTNIGKNRNLLKTSDTLIELEQSDDDQSSFVFMGCLNRINC